MKTKQKPEEYTTLPMLVPSGRKLAWSAFWADKYDAIWPSGRVGNGGYQTIPTKEKAQEIISNIQEAKKVIIRYLTELQLVEELLKKSPSRPTTNHDRQEEKH